MSELDFGQKLDMRRAFWAMGASSRIDVKLSALVTPHAMSRFGVEEWTDLDVLGVQYVPLMGLVFVVADCKTQRQRATERVFWLKGVAELFHAQNAYLFRESHLPSAARQLAHRLGIAAMDSNDRAQFIEQAGNERLPKQGKFLDEDTYRKWDGLLTDLPKSIDGLQRYRRSYYWVFQQRRNLVQLPGYISEHVKEFDPRQRWTQALVIDLACLYLVTVLWAVDELTRLHVSEFESSLQQVFVGGEPELREKQALLKALSSLVGESRVERTGLSVVPTWFPDLVDVAARVARRRAHATEALRILEFTSVETVANRGAAWVHAFPNTDPLDAKLASDVIRFLTRSTGIASTFVDIFDSAVDGSTRIPVRRCCP